MSSTVISYNGPMQKVDENTTVNLLKEMSSKMFGNLVKAVVDLEKEIIVIDVELHSDAEQYLLQQGSKQQYLWGINLHPEQFGSTLFIEYDSMINMRPSQNNLSRDILDPKIRKDIAQLVTKFIKK